MIPVRKILQQAKEINYIQIVKELLFLGKFFLLVITYIVYVFFKMCWHLLAKIPGLRGIFQPIKKLFLSGYTKVSGIFDSADEGEITSHDLIDLAVKHLNAKKNRTIITIGGMSIGFGSVIFLLSLGYGAQNLVVSRVARLNEMKQIDVSVGQASSLQLNEKAMEDFRAIEGVEAVLPFVSVVSKVEYNNSVSDAVAYGVTERYLEESAIQPSRGVIFKDGEVSVSMVKDEEPGMVAGAEDVKIANAKMQKELAQVTYSLYPLTWKPVYAQPSQKSEIIGYTQRVAGEQDAVEVWGERYTTKLDLPEGIDYYGNEYSPWIKDEYPIWSKEECQESEFDCIDGMYTLVRSSGLQQQSAGYITEDDTSLSRYHILNDDGPLLEEDGVVDTIQFSLKKGIYVPVFAGPYTASKELTLFTSQENDGLFSGELIFGDAYVDSNGWGTAATNRQGKQMGYWIRAKLPLWRQLDCADCDELFLKELDSFEKQVLAYTYIRADAAAIESLADPIHFGQVLGEATESAQVASTETIESENDEIETIDEFADIVLDDGTVISSTAGEDGALGWVTMASESGTVASAEKNIISFPEGSQKKVMINRALLNVLGLLEADALGKTFKTSMVLDSEFFEDDYRAETEFTEVEIIGVIPEEKTPAFYLPFSDVKNLGVQNYSQLKVVVNDQNDVKDARKAIEALGFKTASVVDTVSRINSLFGTVRLLLSTLGLVALSIAALGMFNTLTVSLLEKTREVGLMKTIGMKSNEVKRLFLAESIIMGLSGGFFGLFLGAGAGYGLSAMLSTFSVARGLGVINLVYIPIYLVIGILALAFIVGVCTGLYPSYRATKISALNALRYE